MTSTMARAARKAGKQDVELLLDELAAAMTRAFDMSEEDAAEVAAIVAERFADRDEVNDEGLPADLRSLFYTLESRRLMTFRREEYENEEGQKRRAFYWRLRPEVVHEFAVPSAQPTNEDIYHSLPAECWSRTGKAEA
jgi:hypothetical protein